MVDTSGLDEVAGVLDGPRARDAFLLRVVMDPPWSVRVEDEAPLSLVAMVRGGAWVWQDGAAPLRVADGDVVVVRGPDPYTFADDPATTSHAVVEPGQRCVCRGGEDLDLALYQGVRTWGNSPDGTDVMLVGTYQLSGEVSRRLLDRLPPVLVLREGEWDSPLVRVLGDEVVRDQPGQQTVLDRLLDLLVVAVLRAWFSRPDADAPAWYRAREDPVVGRALRMLHNSPAHPWTVGSLAAEVGVSRATLARRFTELVGESPMAFLTDWRLTLASDLLCQPGASVASVARDVGYGSPFAFSNAFKRARGVSPREHRSSVAGRP